MVETTTQFHADHTIPTGGWVFVFGANTAGRHGEGAAKIARKNFHAKFGVGRGPTGSAYAIATKDRQLQALPIETVAAQVVEFLMYARQNPKTEFFVDRTLAEGADERIGALFALAPPNCSLPLAWRGHVSRAREAAAHACSGSCGAGCAGTHGCGGAAEPALEAA